MGSRNPSFSARINAVSRSVPYLKHCCCCVSLTHGIQAITVISLIFGGGFMFLANELVSGDNYEIIYGLCVVTAILFFAWFLSLLLMLSLEIRFPRRLTIWVAWVIMVWLVISLIAFIILEFLLSLNGNLHDQVLVFLIILESLVGITFTIYSIWLIKSYVHLVLDSDSRHPDHIRRSLEATYSSSTKSPPLRSPAPVSSTASVAAGQHINWKRPLSASSFSKILEDYKVIKESQSPKSINREEKSAQVNELTLSDGIIISRPLREVPWTTENRTDSTGEGISRRSNLFKSPPIQVLFMNDHPRYSINKSSLKDDYMNKRKSFMMNQFGISQTHPENPASEVISEVKSNPKLMKQECVFQHENVEIVSEEDINQLSLKGLLETPEPFSNLSKDNYSKKEVEQKSQISNGQKCTCTCFFMQESVLSLEENKTNVTNNKNYRRDVHDSNN